MKRIPIAGISNNPTSQTGTPQLEQLSPDVLLFDEDNPRFGGELSGASQDELKAVLLGDPHYASQLVDSFLQNGYIQYEPLVVRRAGLSYKVIEGNRRLAAVKEITGNPQKYPLGSKSLDKVPALIFPDKKDASTQSDMRVYLGVRHLMGFREWPAHSKAQFLDKESKMPGGLDQVIREVRLTRQQVRRFLIPYRLLKLAGMHLDDEVFWMLAEALQRQGVKKYLQLEIDSKTLEIKSYDKKTFRLLLDDLYGPKDGKSAVRNSAKRKVTDTRYLSVYSNILLSDEATEVLHEGKSLDEAAIYVDTNEQSLARLESAAKNIGVLLKKVVKTPHNDEAKKLLSAYKIFDGSVKEYVKKHG